MNELLQKIQSNLESPDLPDNLTSLFCETLRWGAPGSLAPRRVKLGAPVDATLTAKPVAQLSGLPVFRLDWPENRLPTVTARRAVHRALAPVYAEHLVCYLAQDHRQAAFVWARKRTDGRIEMRTLPYETGSAARTTIERLGELAFHLDEFGLFGEPPITAVTDKLNAAFSVDAVTKNFYQEIANWYFWARDCQDMVLPKDVKNDEDRALFLIRLLTRLIFCWFLRKKRNPQTGQGLLPEELFDEQAIRQSLKDASPESCTYYLAILQNLFFATLNTEMDKPSDDAPNRRFVNPRDGLHSDDHMIHTIWRHDGLLRDPQAFAELLRRVPFLNGGLFECLDDRVGGGKKTEEIRIDGFSSKPRKQPKLPNYLFFGSEQSLNLAAAYGDPARRSETVRPLLSILHSYNFTLTENTPLEQEVALDPELLGHVFENLLAAFNPETGTVARKATGSFYTPRVVVDWMVDQALLVHFGHALPRAAKAKTANSPDPRLAQLLSWDDAAPKFTRAETEALIDAVDHLKAIDPACGSGAFPMGMLQKLVHVLRKLDPENEGWRRRQVAALDKLESAPARDEAQQAIQRAFAHDNDDYGRKLYLIENCLYGVDIQPIACQIAKLRFFIALIVDQSIDPAEPNYGILPLPNLETKIVAANTLIGLQRGQLLLGAERVRRLESELKQVRHQYFTARRYKDKKALRARDKELCEELADVLTELGGLAPDDTQRVVEWNPYNTNKAAPFFDPEWMFGLLPVNGREKGYFDVVIGNPPYVRQEQLRNITVVASGGRQRSLKDVLKDQYECYTGTADMYVYFFERSLQLLRTGGALSFITSNKYMRAAYGQRLRAYLAHATNPRAILDFGDAPVFTSIAYPCILITEKTRHVSKGQLPDPANFAQADKIEQLLDAPDRAVRVHNWKPGGELPDFPELFDQQAQSLEQRELKSDAWRLKGETTQRMRKDIEAAGRPLGEYVRGQIFNGVKSGHTQAFVVDRDTRDSLIRQHESSADVLKPYFRGRDLKRWQIQPPDLWMMYIPWHFPLHDDTSITTASRKAEAEFRRRYPAIYAHLEQFRDELAARDQTETGIRYEWYAMQRPRYEIHMAFEQPKVVLGRFMNKPTYAFDDQGYYHNDAQFMIAGADKFLLAILNSWTSWWWLTNTCTDLQNGYLQALIANQITIRIPLASPDQQQWCERLTSALIWLHGPAAARKAAGTPLSSMKSYFERWLNGLVYELFFPGELHDLKLNLFAETAKLNPPDLSSIPDSQKLGRLRELFEQAYDPKATLRSMLFSLRSLEYVRIIEEPLYGNATLVAEEP
jgi:adenine-specific DNA-methyltransferase